MKVSRTNDPIRLEVSPAELRDLYGGLAVLMNTVDRPEVFEMSEQLRRKLDTVGWPTKSG
jgi:hypothetical protein